jgi:hypothetical protein
MAYHAPRQNATCARCLGSVRRECLDQVLVLGEAHLRRVPRADAAYYNRDRRQQGPAAPAGVTPRTGQGGRGHAVPVRGGLHHAYERAACTPGRTKRPGQATTSSESSSCAGSTAAAGWPSAAARQASCLAGIAPPSRNSTCGGWTAGSSAIIG